MTGDRLGDEMGFVVDGRESISRNFLGKLEQFSFVVKMTGDHLGGRESISRNSSFLSVSSNKCHFQFLTTLLAYCSIIGLSVNHSFNYFVWKDNEKVGKK